MAPLAAGRPHWLRPLVLLVLVLGARLQWAPLWRELGVRLPERLQEEGQRLVLDPVVPLPLLNHHQRLLMLPNFPE